MGMGMIYVLIFGLIAGFCSGLYVGKFWLRD